MHARRLTCSSPPLPPPLPAQSHPSLALPRERGGGGGAPTAQVCSTANVHCTVLAYLKCKTQNVYRCSLCAYSGHRLVPTRDHKLVHTQCVMTQACCIPSTASATHLPRVDTTLLTLLQRAESTLLPRADTMPHPTRLLAYPS